MPHIVIEYSENLNHQVKSSELTKKAHKTVTDSGLFDPQAVKARSIAYNDVTLPDNAQNFLHITTSILSGRTEEEKKSLSTALFQTAKTAIPEIDKLSVNIHEMNINTYTK